MNQLWSLLPVVVGVLGTYIAGRKSKWGWALGFLAQVLWVLYSVAIFEWGLVASSAIYGVVYAKNFLSWRKPAEA